MAIDTVTMYRAICDGCGADAQEDSIWYAWADQDQAVERAITDAGYLRTVDDNHREWLWCPYCTEWTEDEDEEQVPTAKALAYAAAALSEGADDDA